MDVIYHRNCLDGVFSSHLFYLISRVISNQNIDSFVQNMLKRVQAKKSLQTFDQTSEYEKIIDLTPEILDKEIPPMQLQKQLQPKTHPITQDFFHKPNMGVSYCAYSVYAGEFYPLKFPSKSRILLILDTNLVSANNLHSIGQRYDIVIVIDHHTSFIPVKEDILLNKSQSRKLFYIFSEEYCATELCYHFLQKYFRIDDYFENQHMESLKTMIGYISANDRKHNETRESKTFVLGFYYFDIELSHMNPLVNKRIAMLNLEYLMEKGANLYKTHIQDIAKQIHHAMICRLQMSGKMKGLKFYILKPSDPNKISDIGVVLSYLSRAHDMENLAMLYMQRSDQLRISTRSHRFLSNPLALQLAQKYQGGGHLCASGFRVSNQKFKSQFTKLPCDKGKLVLTSQQVEKILLGKDLIIS